MSDITKYKFYRRTHEIMREVHKGQIRKGSGRDYFSDHLEKVVEIADEYVNSEFYLNVRTVSEEEYENLLIVALSHDADEDHRYKPETLVDELTKIGLETDRGEEIIKALNLLNKKKFNSYLEYILAAKRHWVSRISKISDLTHNSSDLNSGSLRDKYMLAKHILELD